MKKTILFFTVIFLSLLSQAEFTNTKCEHALLGNNIIQVNRQYDPATRSCFISVSPRNIANLKYRDYYFDQLGRFMVFNSYGNGPIESYTGARDFFLFPIVDQYPDFSFEQNGDVIIKMVSGHQLRISGKDFSLVSLSDGTVSEKPLSNKNAGGVEITLTKGFWLDTGFRLGGLNIANPNKSTLFKSPATKESCSVKNSKFMDYADKDNPDFKYNGEPFIQFIRTTCPRLGL